jgi:hypothetical protein
MKQVSLFLFNLQGVLQFEAKPRLGGDGDIAVAG